MNTTPDQALAELLESGSLRPAPEVNAILRSIWPELRAPQRSHHGTELVALFQRAGYVSDGILQPEAAIKVYRGELVDAREPGISWTADIEIATRYARGYATVGHSRVVQADAPPAAVLARFTLDAEVVVAPEQLTGVETAGYIRHFTLPCLAPF
jgi:hypothetical protein